MRSSTPGGTSPSGCWLGYCFSRACSNSREAASGRVQPFSTIATIGAERREHCAAPLSWAGRRVCALPHGPGYHYGFEKRPIVRLRLKRGRAEGLFCKKCGTSAEHKKSPTYPHIVAPMRYPVDGQGRCLKGTRGACDGRYVGLPRGSKVVPELGGC
jgi:hypothetical protein